MGGLSEGPESAASEELCMQACCDAGYDCQMYQFIERGSGGAQCFIGQSDSFEDDPLFSYRGAARDPHNGWKLEVGLSRYIFASIDNVELTRGATDAIVV